MASSAPKKRKKLHDFWDVMPRETPGVESNRDARDLDSLKIPGLSILRDFVTAGEEDTILSFLATQKWRTDLSRRTIHYGGTYCLMPPRGCSPEERTKIEATILTAEALPRELQWLVERMTYQQLYRVEGKPEFCIVNEYVGSQGISAHVENFRFGEPVCALTLRKGDFMQFHKLSVADDGSVRSGKAAQARRSGERREVWLPTRSLLVMKGAARSQWQHEIRRSKKGRSGADWRRVSLTFRVKKAS